MRDSSAIFFSHYLPELMPLCSPPTTSFAAVLIICSYLFIVLAHAQSPSVPVIAILTLPTARKISLHFCPFLHGTLALYLVFSVHIFSICTASYPLICQELSSVADCRDWAMMSSSHARCAYDFFRFLAILTFHHYMVNNGAFPLSGRAGWREDYLHVRQHAI